MPLDRDTVTDGLDLAALALLATGLAGGLWEFLGWWALMAAGVLVLLGSATIAARTTSGRRRPRRNPPADLDTRRGA